MRLWKKAPMSVWYVYSNEEKYSEIPGKKFAGTAFLHLSKLEQEWKICEYIASDRLEGGGEILVFSFCCSSFPRLLQTLALATFLSCDEILGTIILRREEII